MASARVSPRALSLVAVGALLVVAFGLPHWADWDVASRAPRSAVPHPVPPLHGWWRPLLFGPGTLPAVALAYAGWRWGPGLAARLSWRRVLAVAYVGSLAWMLALALVDGPDGLTRQLADRYDYLPAARRITDVSTMLHEYVDRIPLHSTHAWPTQFAGHPPGMGLVFVALVRLGLGGDLAAALVVTAIGAATPVAVLATLRLLDREQVARRAAPFLVLTPAAVFMAVSGDALIATACAVGAATLAYATTARGPRWIVAAVLAGLIFGYVVMMSYGMVLFALVALGIVAAARGWRVLPVVAISALAVVLAFALAGFSWWEAFPVLRQRYWDGIASDRPAAYWLWGDLAALVVCTGPLLGPVLAQAASRGRDRVVALLVGSTVVAILVADLSRMSKAEVERIWLPFVPWLLLGAALLPDRWRRWGLLLQLVAALAVQQLLYTTW